MISKLVVPLLAVAGLTFWAGAEVAPLPNTHAHNDYEHKRPLLDALDHGFCSVEADIYLVDGKLLVAHDRSKVKPEGTLEHLYLDPLRERASLRRGKIYGSEEHFWLLIDIKSDGKSVYPVLQKVLEGYRGMLTRYEGKESHPGAVTIVLSGNRPRELVHAEGSRLVALDGLLADLDTNPPALLVPWISEPWSKLFQWNGRGKIGDADQLKLQVLLKRIHGQGRLARFWGAPDTPEFWTMAVANSIDLINSDDLEGLQKFLGQKTSAVK
jgi:hypothetical protein